MSEDHTFRVEEMENLLANIRNFIEREFDMDVQGIEERVKEADKLERTLEKRIDQEGACKVFVDASSDYLRLATEAQLLAIMGNDITKINDGMDKLDQELKALKDKCDNEKKVKKAKGLISKARERRNVITYVKEEQEENDYPTIKDTLEILDQLD